MKDRDNIVFILPRGESIRNFVYTETIDKVAEHADVTILTVIPGEDMKNFLKARYGKVISLTEFSEPWIVRIFREILEMAHGRWLWSGAAKARWHLRSVEVNTPAKWLKLSAKRLLCYPFSNRVGLRFLSALERKVTRFFCPALFYRNLFRDIKPALVFNSSHFHAKVALQAIEAAQEMGIPTATFIFSWDNLTSQGRIFPSYDYYLVWNDSIRNQLLNIYDTVKPEQVFVTGTPQFDFHFRPEFYWAREEFCARIGADASRPIILYTTGMVRQMPEEPRVVDGIAHMIQDMKEFGPPQLLVRVYPKDTTDRFSALKKKNLPDVIFPDIPWYTSWLTPKYEDCFLWTNMLRHCAMGINVASTVSLELCMFDKPVINVCYNPPHVDIRPVDYKYYYKFEHYIPVAASGAVMIAHSEEEMRKILRETLIDSHVKSINRKELIKNMFGDSLDGNVGKKIADKLVELGKRSDRVLK